MPLLLVDEAARGVSPSSSALPLESHALAAALKPKSAFHQAWRIIDDHYIKPLVGGKLRSAHNAEATDDEA